MPIIDFTVQAGTTFATMQAFDTNARTMNLNLEQIATNFRSVSENGRIFTTQITGLTTDGRRLTTTFREEAGALVILNQRLTENAGAARAATQAAQTRARAGDALTARRTLTGGVNLSGLEANQLNAVNSLISTVTQSVARGRATLQEFTTAAAVASGQASALAMSEAEHKIVDSLTRIRTITERATEQSRARLGLQRERGTGERFGQSVALRLQRQVAPRLDLIDPSAQERVRRQIANIQQLFARGLTPQGYRNAFQAFTDGGVRNLTRLEQEARHRLERIRIEMEKAPRGGFLSTLFGGGGPGGSGGGAVGSILGGSTGKIVQGLILAEGVERLGETIKETLNEAAEFEKQIALLRTLSQDTGDSFNQWADSIVRVSNAVGKSREEIAQAGYDLLSNQVTKGVADTEAALTSASRFAVVTNSTTQDTVNLLSSVINSFGYTAGNTDQILTKLFTTIDLGRIKASDLANTLGRPAVAARALGVSFDELQAAQITISQTGLGVEQTNTLITNVFHKLLNPTKELQAYYDKLGVSTGDNFVKTYGFAGAMKLLAEETQGSSAKIAEFFNEIRGEQGFTQLALRMGVFTDALHKLKTLDTLKGALEEFDKLPGQKFREEMEKLSNVFLKFKDIALRVTIQVTEVFGGLGGVMENLIWLSFGLGTALGGAAIIHSFQAATANAIVFQAVLAGIRTSILSFSAISIGTIIGLAAGELYAGYSDRVNAAAIAQNEAAENIKSQNIAISEANNKALAANEDTLRKMQGQALEYVNKTKAALATVAVKQQEIFKIAGGDLKNSMELASQAFKKVIADGEAREKAAQDNVDKYRERQITRRASFHDDVFERQKRVNEINVSQGGPDRENKIYKDRINQLVNQAARLVKGKRPEDAEKIIERINKAKEIAKERANLTTTDNFGNQVFKYADGWREVLRLTALEGKLIRQNALDSKQAAKDLVKQNDLRREELKKYQDLADAVINFKVFDENGKFRFKSPEEALKKYSEAEDAFRKQGERINAPENLTQAGALGNAESLRRNKERVEKDLAERRGRITPLLDTEKQQREAEKTAFTTAKEFAAQQQKLRESAIRKTQAGQEYAGAKESAVKGFEAVESGTKVSTLEKIANEGLGLITGHKPLQNAEDLMPPDIRALLTMAKDATLRNDIDEGLRLLALVRKKLAERGGLNAPFRTAGGSDTVPGPNGTTQPATMGTHLDLLKTQLLTGKDAKETVQAEEIAGANQMTEIGNYVVKLGEANDGLLSLGRIINGWETTSKEAFTAVNADATKLFDTFKALNREMADATSAALSIGKIKESFAEGKPHEAITKPLGKGSVLKEHLGGQVHHYADGGMLHDFFSGAYKQGSDKIPIMGADREVMMNQRASDRFLPQLIAMNAGFDPSSSSARQGGNSYSFGDMHFHVKGGDSVVQTARELGAAMKRQIRRGNLELS